MVPEMGETPVADFAVELFEILDYIRQEQVARTPLFICGGSQARKNLATTNVCIFDCSLNDILPLSRRTRAQLVAKTVGAFTVMRIIRTGKQLDSLPSRKSLKVMQIGIGTSPQIPITQTLSTPNIRHGTYLPPEETRVAYCYTPVPRPSRRDNEGMKPLENKVWNIEVLMKHSN